MADSGRLPRPRLPAWIRVKVEVGSGREEVTALLRDLRLNTVCAGARCPNLGECFHRRTATFLIMGDHCTRNCRFCGIPCAVQPLPPEPDEAKRVAEAAAKLQLRYVVITSVTRDDLPDGGAGCFAAVIEAVRRRLSETGVEVLTPDFNGDADAIRRVLAAGPAVFNHNLETVERLSGKIRCRATYRRSLKVLALAAEIGGRRIPVKSGLMVGLGEDDSEVLAAMRDLRDAGVTLLTVGQYLPPSSSHWPLARYVTPEQFERYQEAALAMGFVNVASGPLVRSSFRAEELVGAQERVESEKTGKKM